jgi:hypothetical protein
MAKMFTNLTKFYSGDDLKFGGDFYDVFDAKLKIFYDLCDKAGIGPGYYHSAYGTMLKGKAQDFYYQHLFRQQLTYEEMVTKTRAYFHTPENHQLYLSEWRTILLKDVIATNSDKNL